MEAISALPARALLAGPVAALMLLGSGTEAHAQDPDPSDPPLFACYVPSSGTVYRIKVPGLPDECRADHIEFSFFAKGDQGDPGPQGEPGPPGPQGDQGPAGPAGGLTGVEVVRTDIFAIPSGETSTIQVDCPAGYVATGGGFSSTTLSSDFLVQSSRPKLFDPPGWQVVVRNRSGEAGISAWAVCAPLATS